MSKFSVYQHWDPLKVCVVGRSYPPEFYSWITVPHVRKLFERIAMETEEDYQKIIKKLEQFGVEVLRPKLVRNAFIGGKYMPPPMNPRDYNIMIGDRLYENYTTNIKQFYKCVKDSGWPDCNSYDEFLTLPQHIQDECNEVHHLQDYIEFYSSYEHVYERVQAQGNQVIHHFGDPDIINGAMISRIGRDLYFGTTHYKQDPQEIRKFIDPEFTKTRNHVINTGGHSDGTYCPVTPGLIISLMDVPTYADTFPGWEVVYLPGQSWSKVKDFLKLKERNSGRWWIPGFETDQAVVNVVEKWLGHWTGYVEETVFDVNMLVIDPKNVMVFNYNKQVFDALERYGVTPHIVPFRHRFFWDGGIHCITSDLHREGVMQDFFSERN